MSIGQSCNAGLKIKLAAAKIRTIKDGTTEDIILQGKRSSKDKILYLELATSNNKGIK